MIVAGCLIRILGIMVFFLTSHFMMQKLPIALCMNALTVFNMPQFVEDVLQPANPESEQRTDMVMRYMNFETMTELFDKLCKIPHTVQLASPFASPITAIACVLYTGLLVAMTTCAALYSNDRLIQDFLPNESVEWKVLYSVLVIAVFIANLHSILIGGFWLTIISAILATLKVTGFILLVGGRKGCTDFYSRRRQL